MAGLLLRDATEDDLETFFQNQLDPDANRMAASLYARAAKDNVASLRVLEKCGFAIVGEDKGFSNARGEEVDELILKLEA